MLELLRWLLWVVLGIKGILLSGLSGFTKLPAFVGLSGRRKPSAPLTGIKTVYNLGSKA